MSGKKHGEESYIQCNVYVVWKHTKQCGGVYVYVDTCIKYKSVKTCLTMKKRKFRKLFTSEGQWDVGITSGDVYRGLQLHLISSTTHTHTQKVHFYIC